MKFDLQKSIEILSKTPSVLETLLTGLSDEWLMNNEGDNTWSPYEVLGHLIHGEKTDWMVRSEIILSDLPDKTFEPFDRYAQSRNDQQRTIEELLVEFRKLREANVHKLKELRLTESDFAKTGIHPELGVSRLKELLSTWTVHDLGHIAQITRVMAKQYKTEVGPWRAYLGILKV